MFSNYKIYSYIFVQLEAIYIYVQLKDAIFWRQLNEWFRVDSILKSPKVKPHFHFNQK